MKKLGSKKMRTRVEGHQDCSVCHPDTKGGRVHDKRIAFEHEQLSNDDNCGKCYDCLDDPDAGLENPTLTKFIACVNCGNKRCPKATNHCNECTNSNAPNQPGSRFFDLHWK